MGSINVSVGQAQIDYGNWVGLTPEIKRLRREIRHDPRRTREWQRKRASLATLMHELSKPGRHWGRAIMDGKPTRMASIAVDGVDHYATVSVDLPVHEERPGEAVPRRGTVTVMLQNSAGALTTFMQHVEVVVDNIAWTAAVAEIVVESVGLLLQKALARAVARLVAQDVAVAMENLAGDAGAVAREVEGGMQVGGALVKFGKALRLIRLGFRAFGVVAAFAFVANQVANRFSRVTGGVAMMNLTSHDLQWRVSYLGIDTLWDAHSPSAPTDWHDFLKPQRKGRTVNGHYVDMSEAAEVGFVLTNTAGPVSVLPIELCLDLRIKATGQLLGTFLWNVRTAGANRMAFLPEVSGSAAVFRAQEERGTEGFEFSRSVMVNDAPLTVSLTTDAVLGVPTSPGERELWGRNYVVRLELTEDSAWLVNRQSGRALTAREDMISQQPLNAEDPTQEWMVYRAEQGDALINRGSKKALDFDLNNHRLVMWNFHGGTNQQWKLPKPPAPESPATGTIGNAAMPLFVVEVERSQNLSEAVNAAPNMLVFNDHQSWTVQSGPI
ncbi:MAG: RICIN domain-containing protein [Roseateles sp.]|uniref:RICIN domain-containing protein n=1 Tax=Roseateles sp. TaxID=1971397 RepID=UPI00403605F0